MARTLLALIQQAANEIGVVGPTALFGATDNISTQFLALAQREGQSFADEATNRGGWQELRKDYTFNLSPGVTSYALPADYSFMLPQTFWNQAQRWRLVGPLSQQEWSVLQYGISPAGPRLRFKISGGMFWVNPAPGSGQTDAISYAYVSTNWCRSSGGAAQAAWQADADSYLLDEEAFILGVKWRYLAAKGLPQAADARPEYRARVDLCKARNGGSRTLPLNAVSAEEPLLLSGANVPDTGYGA